MEKIPYTASRTKRFDISEDSFSRERVRAAYHALCEVRQIHPFVVGGILLGSLTKGKVLTKETAPKTDLDLVVYIDLDEIAEEKWKKPNDPDFQEISQAVKMMYKMMGYPKEDRHNEVVATYVDTLVRKAIDKELSQDNKFEGGDNPGLKVRPISFKGEDSIFGTVESVGKYVNLARPSTSLAPAVYSSVSLVWGLDLGGGLKQYRQAYLKELRELPLEKREHHWSIVAYLISFFERNWDIPENLKRFYPQTFDEAVKYYLVA